MPAQCKRGWLADLRLCGPFSRRWRSFFTHAGTGRIAFLLQQHSFMPGTMCYYWFWIDMEIFGELGPYTSLTYFSFFHMVEVEHLLSTRLGLQHLGNLSADLYHTRGERLVVEPGRRRSLPGELSPLIRRTEAKPTLSVLWVWAGQVSIFAV